MYMLRFWQLRRVQLVLAMNPGASLPIGLLPRIYRVDFERCLLQTIHCEGIAQSASRQIHKKLLMGIVSSVES